LTATLAVVGLASIARVVGPAERYVFYWRVPLALLVVFVTGWTLWLAAHLDEYPQARRIVSPPGPTTESTSAFAGAANRSLLSAVTASSDQSDGS
jgi:hypothetical protein